MPTRLATRDNEIDGAPGFQRKHFQRVATSISPWWAWISGVYAASIGYVHPAGGEVIRPSRDIVNYRYSNSIKNIRSFIIVFYHKQVCTNGDEDKPFYGRT